MKIICIGRNYSEHAKELQNEVPKEPVFFMKPDSALLKNNQDFFYPGFCGNLHYEVEVVIRINRLGKYIEERFANRYYDEVALGIDFTARDLQNKMKEKGLPWEIAKAFDQSAVLSNFIALNRFLDVQHIPFSLQKNGETVQEGNTSDMIFTVDQIIAYVSKFLTLKIGDLIYTGTPAGVGRIDIGDRLTGYIADKKMFDFMIR